MTGTVIKTFDLGGKTIEEACCSGISMSLILKTLAQDVVAQEQMNSSLKLNIPDWMLKWLNAQRISYSRISCSDETRVSFRVLIFHGPPNTPPRHSPLPLGKPGENLEEGVHVSPLVY